MSNQLINMSQYKERIIINGHGNFANNVIIASNADKELIENCKTLLKQLTYPSEYETERGERIFRGIGKKYHRQSNGDR